MTMYATYKCWIGVIGSHAFKLESQQASVAIDDVLGLIVVQKRPLRKPPRLKGSINNIFFSKCTLGKAERQRLVW